MEDWIAIPVLILSATLFTIGTVGVLVRRNALVMFMSVELQLNAVNLTLVAFSRQYQELDGQILAFFSMVVAAAEVVVEEIEGNPGYYSSKFFLRPHYQLEGLTVSLRLVSKLPSGKAG